MNKKLIEQISDETGVHGTDVERVLDWLTETQIVTYTFDDPDGANFCYPDLDDLVLDLMCWDEGTGAPWAIFTQIEFRDPVHFVQFVDGNPELVQ